MLPELICLAMTVYYEGRSESFPGQVAIAEVVMNRVADARYPDSICGVVTQGGTRRHRCQFSYHCDGKPEAPANWRAWRRSRVVASLAYHQVVDADLKGATHYHADYASPAWRHELQFLGNIGTHIFYSGH